MILNGNSSSQPNTTANSRIPEGSQPLLEFNNVWTTREGRWLRQNLRNGLLVQVKGQDFTCWQPRCSSPRFFLWERMITEISGTCMLNVQKNKITIVKTESRKRYKPVKQRQHQFHLAPGKFNHKQVNEHICCNRELECAKTTIYVHLMHLGIWSADTLPVSHFVNLNGHPN